MESLLENGIGNEAIRQTLEAFSARPVIELPQRMGDVAMHELAALLAEGATHGRVAEVSEVTPDTDTVIVANTGDFEAVACANVLRALLAPQLCDNADRILCVCVGAPVAAGLAFLMSPQGPPQSARHEGSRQEQTIPTNIS